MGLGGKSCDSQQVRIWAGRYTTERSQKVSKGLKTERCFVIEKFS